MAGKRRVVRGIRQSAGIDDGPNDRAEAKDIPIAVGHEACFDASLVASSSSVILFPIVLPRNSSIKPNRPALSPATNAESKWGGSCQTQRRAHPGPLRFMDSRDSIAF